MVDLSHAYEIRNELLELKGWGERRQLRMLEWVDVWKVVVDVKPDNLEQRDISSAWTDT